jgi:hypothetical protein
MHSSCTPSLTGILGTFWLTGLGQHTVNNRQFKYRGVAQPGSALAWGNTRGAGAKFSKSLRTALALVFAEAYEFPAGALLSLRFSSFSCPEHKGSTREAT